MRNYEYDDAELALCGEEETGDAFVFSRVIAVIIFTATIISSVLGALLFAFGLGALIAVNGDLFL